MTVARKQQVCLQATTFYHCVTRCVRRAFLCGNDYESGRDFNHRKQWIVDRLKKLSSIFSIDLCAYSVMSNHYHVIARIDEAQALKWTANEVIQRWRTLFRGHSLVDRYIAGEALSPGEQEVIRDLVGLWRRRLYDLSWFMRCINEPIARIANREDDCRGHFWESRFKCQALLDEAALISCMVYVDLNPIRAGVSETPETSHFTSIQDRIRQYKQTVTQPHAETDKRHVADGLAPLVPHQDQRALPVDVSAYIELVDWTGRAIRSDKRGHIPENISAIFVRLHIETDRWTQTVKHFGRRFHYVVGTVDRIRWFSRIIGRKWMNGLSSSRQFYRNPATQCP